MGEKKKKALVPYDRRHIARAAELKAAPKGDGSHRKGPALTRSREYIKELDPDLSVRRKHFKKKKKFLPLASSRRENFTHSLINK